MEYQNVTNCAGTKAFAYIIERIDASKLYYLRLRVVLNNMMSKEEIHFHRIFFREITSLRGDHYFYGKINIFSSNQRF